MGSSTVPQPTAIDFYRILIETRNGEIKLFWERSNYFLVLNTGIAFGFFNLTDPKYKWGMAIFGLLASVLWLRVCLGGKFWQTRWEQRLQDFEKHNFPQLEFFAALPKRIRQDVEKGLDFFESKNPAKRLVNLAVYQKPSVSFSMIILALLFVLGWLALIVMLSFFSHPDAAKIMLPTH